MATSVKLPRLPIAGDLSIPGDARAIVIFAHGSGSGRSSVRNQAVAAHLRAEGLGTLLIDLLSAWEEERVENRFDLDLLAGRLR